MVCAAQASFAWQPASFSVSLFSAGGLTEIQDDDSPQIVQDKLGNREADGWAKHAADLAEPSELES